MNWNRRDWLLLLAVTLVAAALRFYQLGVVPPGPQFDEAFNAIDAEQILAGNRPLFLPANGGREVLYSYYQAALGALFGLNVHTLRLASALAGIATVAAAYVLTRRLFRVHSQAVATFTALALAVSYWHVHFSHYGIRIILQPLLFSGVFGFFWLGMAGGSRRVRLAALIASGVLAGLSVWNNPTGRFAPFVLVIYVLWLLWRYPERRRVHLDSPLGGLVLAGAAAFVVFLPLGLEFLRHPDWFFGHASEVSVFAARVSGEAPPAMLLANNTLRVLGMFSFDGDLEWAHGIADRPVFDWFMALAFYAGVVIWGLRLFDRLQPRPDPDRDALVLFLIWGVTMLAPSVFSEAAPNYSRTLPAIPAVMLAPGLALAWLATWPRLRPWLGPALAVGVVAASCVVTVYDYFVRFPSFPQVYYVFDADKVDALNYLATQTDEYSVYLSPLWSEHATVGFLRPRGVKAFEATETTVLPAPGRGALYAFPAEHVDYAEDVADRWGVTPEVLNDRFDRPLMVLVRLAPEVANQWPPGLAPDSERKALFDDGPSLIGMKNGESGSELALYWRSEEKTYRDLTAFVHLVDARGRRVGQADKLPGDGFYRTPSWAPGERVIQRFTPEISDLCAGGEEVRVLTGWYEYAADGQRRPRRAAPGDTAFAGTLTLPYVSAPADRFQLDGGQNISLASDLTLIGHKLAEGAAEPGAPLTLELVLLGDGAQADTRLELTLRPQEGQAGLEAISLWAGPAAPGAEWRPGEAVCRRLHLRLPGDLAPGDYTLALHGGDTDQTGGQAFADLTVQPSSRSFELPAVERPVSATLGDIIRLHGLDTARAGEVLTVTLVWQALAAPTTSEQVFVHLVGPDGAIVAQSDAAPAGGYDTVRWVEGEVVVDPQALALPPDLPAGGYALRVGMYDPATGVRLEAMSADGSRFPDDAVAAGQVEIEAR